MSSPQPTHSPSSASPDLRTPVKKGLGPRRCGDGSSSDGAASRPGSVPLLLVEDADIPAQNCLRLVLLGSARIGKTSIVSRFLSNKYDDKYTPTIEDFHRKIYRIRGESYRLDILDTSGNDPFPAMKRLSLLTGDLFLVVYAVDCRESFEEAIRLRNQIYEAKMGQMTPTMTPVSGGPNSNSPRVRQKHLVPIVIVGNKCDLESSRVVDMAELRQLTDTHPSLCDVIECSAKRNINIEELFVKLFVLAKVPTEMSPSLHRKAQPAYVGCPSSPRSSRSSSSLRLMSLRRRLSDACGAVALNARRPSIRTDLLNLQTRKNQPGDGDSDSGRMDLSRCSLQ